MRQTTRKPVSGKPKKARSVPIQAHPKPTSGDDQLTDHLKQAEDHLIEAVKLFSGPQKVTRRAGYQEKLERSQEAITTLYREELVRIRGTVRRRGTK